MCQVWLHACISRTWESEAEGFGVPGQPDYTVSFTKSLAWATERDLVSAKRNL